MIAATRLPGPLFVVATKAGIDGRRNPALAGTTRGFGGKVTDLMVAA